MTTIESSTASRPFRLPNRTTVEPPLFLFFQIFGRKRRRQVWWTWSTTMAHLSPSMLTVKGKWPPKRSEGPQRRSSTEFQTSIQFNLCTSLCHKYPDKFHWKTQASLKAKSSDIFLFFVKCRIWVVSITSRDTQWCLNTYSLSRALLFVCSHYWNNSNGQTCKLCTITIGFIYSSWACLIILKIHNLLWCISRVRIWW